MSEFDIVELLETNPITKMKAVYQSKLIVKLQAVDCHKRTFKNFRLMNAFKVDNKLQIENAMKQHPLLRGNRRTVKINAINQTELLVMDGSHVGRGIGCHYPRNYNQRGV